MRQRHRHVEIGDACVEGPVEDRHHEPRIDGVQDVGDVPGAAELGDRRCIGRIDLRGAEPTGAGVVAIDDALCSCLVVVGEHDGLVEVSSRRDRRERRAHTA
jgi:hypothetical protein